MSDSILPSFLGSEASTPDPAEEAPEIPRHIGAYRLDEVLGRGGMGVVYRARHLELGQDRALKVMNRPESTKGVARFRREATNLARVRHPNVVHIYEFGEHEGKLFFVMEFVEGKALDQLIFEGLSLPRALQTFIGVAEGVQALHEAGVIHRDLKPGNVVVTGERPVVLDLGLAVNPELDQRLTKTGATLGTVNYMAPEQFRSAKQANEQTDVYALGLLLFELCTGTPAVGASKTHHEMAVEILRGTPPKPSARNPDLPLALDAVCARALARDPQERWPSAQALADAVRALREHPGPTRRQERAKLIAVCGAGLIGLAVGLFFAFPISTPVTAPAPEPADATTSGAPLTTNAQTLSRRELREARAALRSLLKPHGLPPDRRYAAARSWLAAYPVHPERDKVEAAAAQALLSVPFDSLPHSLVRKASFVREGEQVLSAGGNAIRLWDVATGGEVRSWPLTASPWALAVHGERFAVGGAGPTVLVGALDTKTGSLIKRTEAKTRVRALQFSPDGAVLAIGSTHGVELVDLSSGALVRTLGPLLNPVIALGFSGDGAHLATLSGIALDRLDGREAANVLTVWNVADGSTVASHPFMAVPQALGFCGDGRTFVVATDGRRLLAYDVVSGQQRGELLASGVTPGVSSALRAAHDGVIRGVAIPPDVNQVISVSGNRGAPTDNNQIRVWDLDAAKLIHAVEGRPTEMMDVDTVPGGRRFLVVVPGAVELWDISALDAGAR